MPPVIRMGVRATERSPSSTLKRSTSIRLVQTRNRGAISENKNVSAIRASSNHRSPLGSARPPEPVLKIVDHLRMLVTIASRQTDRDRNQDDGPLYRLLPIGADAQKRETGADGAEQNYTQQGSHDGARTAGDRRSSHDHRSDYFHLQSQAGIAGNLVE